MLHGLFIASLVSNCYQAIKDAFSPVVPAENWANKDLIHKDRMNGMSEKEILKNVHKGKYFLKEEHEEPHRDLKTGHIIIENSLLWEQDIKKYGYSQAHEWVRQGRYNLSPEELEKELKRINKHHKELYNLP